MVPGSSSRLYVNGQCWGLDLGIREDHEERIKGSLDRP